MAGERVDRFNEWYQQNRYVVESGLGEFCLLQKDIYVECGGLHEEQIGSNTLKMSSRILEDYSDGLRTFSVEFFVSLESNRKKHRILCCDKKIINVGETFYVPSKDNFSLFKLKGIYIYNNSVWIGPRQLGIPIRYKY